MTAGTTPEPGAELGDERKGDRPDIAVVGGGWSGIAAAWRLHSLGASVTLYDEQEELGGRSAGVPVGPRTLTAGGKNIGRKYANFRAFGQALGCSDYEFFGINSARSEGGKLRTIDSTRRFSSIFHLLRKLPARDIYRMLKLVRAIRSRRENSFCGGPDLVRIARKAGDPPLSEYFGRGIQEKLVRSLTVRMNGAEADEVHLECFGTHLGMVLDSFEQLSSGFDELFAGLAKQITVRSSTRVTELAVDGGRVTGVVAQERGGEAVRTGHDAVVVALPGPAASALLEPLSAGLAAELSGINYFPAAVVLAEYDRPVFGEQVRAVVQPADSPLSNAGAYGINDRHIVRYTFSGRTYRAAHREDAELVALAEEQLAKHVDLDGVSRVRAVTKRWEHAYVGYSRYHSATIRRIDQELKPFDGLALTGDYLRGASIEACFRAAYERTDALLARLGTRSGGR
ncbi:protoporphyrinogen/coproporphyrinogen oxidase [Streptomyces sp. NPDC057136]|uniref:protoporphyrinogen/coproporphyrinogen oxidase n=1 Tax=Streptomyces sp. NPDC057136 TaxID=3346029 RepID=UPI00362AC496